MSNFIEFERDKEWWLEDVGQSAFKSAAFVRPWVFLVCTGRYLCFNMKKSPKRAAISKSWRDIQLKGTRTWICGGAEYRARGHNVMPDLCIHLRKAKTDVTLLHHCCIEKPNPRALEEYNPCKRTGGRHLNTSIWTTSFVKYTLMVNNWKRMELCVYNHIWEIWRGANSEMIVSCCNWMQLGCVEHILRTASSYKYILI